MSGTPRRRRSSLLTSQAAALYPQTLTKCLGQLDKPDSFGGLPLNQLVKPTADIATAVDEAIARALETAHDDGEFLATVLSALRLLADRLDTTR